MGIAELISLCTQGGFGALLGAMVLWLAPKALRSAADSRKEAARIEAASRQEAAMIEADSRREVMQAQEAQMRFLVSSFEHQMKYEREQCNQQFRTLLERLDEHHAETMRLFQALSAPR